MSAPKKNAAEEAWTQFLAGLSRKARAHMEAGSKDPVVPLAAPPQEADDDADAFERFAGGLSTAARTALSGLPEPEPPERAVSRSNARYGLLEAHDGDWPVLKLYKKPEAVARRLAALQGKDVVVSVFFGLPLAITRGPQRYLFLPGGEQAIEIPVVEGLPTRTVPAEQVAELPVEESGFFGPPELYEGKSQAEPVPVGDHVDAADDD